MLQFEEGKVRVVGRDLESAAAAFQVIKAQCEKQQADFLKAPETKERNEVLDMLAGFAGQAESCAGLLLNIKAGGWQ